MHSYIRWFGAAAFLTLALQTALGTWIPICVLVIGILLALRGLQLWDGCQAFGPMDPGPRLTIRGLCVTMAGCMFLPIADNPTNWALACAVLATPVVAIGYAHKEPKESVSWDRFLVALVAFLPPLVIFGAAGYWARQGWVGLAIGGIFGTGAIVFGEFIAKWREAPAAEESVQAPPLSIEHKKPYQPGDTLDTTA